MTEKSFNFTVAMIFVNNVYVLFFKGVTGVNMPPIPGWQQPVMGAVPCSPLVKKMSHSQPIVSTDNVHFHVTRIQNEFAMCLLEQI
jgi:hypothetical protein